MTKKEQLEKFIKDNNLVFKSGHRNTPCTILAGYACYIEADRGDLKDVLRPIDIESAYIVNNVFKCAKRNRYEQYWKTDEAKKQYKF